MLKNKKVQVIGLHALAGWGKTEVAERLFRDTGFTVITFAEPLKRAAAALYDIDIKYFYEGDHGVDRNTTIITPYGMTIRAMMTNLADALKNQNGGDFFLKLLTQRMEVALERYPDTRGFIVEDVRYDHTGPWGKSNDEYGLIKSLGGTVIHIDSEERAGKSAVHTQHSSEKGIARLDGDIILDNNGSLDDLDKLVSHLVQHFHWNKL